MMIPSMDFQKEFLRLGERSTVRRPGSREIQVEGAMPGRARHYGSSAAKDAGGGQVIEAWNKLPEPVRWVLFLPAVLVVWAVFNLFARLSTFFLRESIAELICTFLSALFLFPIIFMLAPRGRVLIGWIVYVVMVVLVIGLFGFIPLVARRLATWGLLGEALLPPPGVQGWRGRDWMELVQCGIWLVVGTQGFLSCRAEDKGLIGIPRTR